MIYNVLFVLISTAVKLAALSSLMIRFSAIYLVISSLNKNLVDARPEDDEKRTASIYTNEQYQSKPPAAVLSLLKHSGALRLFQEVLLDGLITKEEQGVFINVTASSSYFETVEEEGENSIAVEDAIRGQSLGNLPIRIIARNVPPDYEGSGISKEAGEQIEQIWREGQESMLTLSSNSQLIIAKQSGHMIMKDQPGLIIQVIRELLLQQASN